MSTPSRPGAHCHHQRHVLFPWRGIFEPRCAPTFASAMCDVRYYFKNVGYMNASIAYTKLRREFLLLKYVTCVEIIGAEEQCEVWVANAAARFCKELLCHTDGHDLATRGGC